MLPTSHELAHRVRDLVQAAAGATGHRVVGDNGRDVTVLPDDRWLVSYPRSGNTWLSFLLTNLEHDTPTTFANLERRCPDIYANGERELRGIQSPRLLKSHEYFDPRYRRVLYLVRDPRDVAASYLRFLVKLRQFRDLDDVGEFMRGYLDGDLDSYGTWAENVGSWLGARRDDADFRIVRYEDLHANTVEELARAAEFLGVDAGEAELRRAIDLSAPERMRRLEQTEAPLVPELKETRLDVPFVGDAAVGSGRTLLSDEHQHAIAARWGDVMSQLGYE